MPPTCKQFWIVNCSKSEIEGLGRFSTKPKPRYSSKGWLALAMRPALQPAAPSRRLLRFLRSQSDGVPFFSPHLPHLPHHAHVQPAAPCPCRAHTRRLTGGPALTTTDPQPLSRPYSTSRPRHPDAALSSLPFRVDNVLPRHLKRVRSPGLSLLAANRVAASRRSLSSDDTTKGGGPKKPSEELWGDHAVRPDFRSRGTDELEDSIFTSSMGRRAKAALEPVLRCTEVDEQGDAILTDGAFKKTEIIAKVSRPA